MTELREIGWWRNENDPDLSRLIDTAWDDDECRATADYLEYGICVGALLSGPSKCRLCDFALPDSLVLTDGTYEWPQLLFHYVGVHKVRLPTQVIQDMLSTLSDLEESPLDSQWWKDHAFEG
jgi:hypothetical protein